MPAQYSISLVICLVLVSFSISDPSITIQIDGEDTSKFVNGGPVYVSDRSLTFPPSRFYIGDKDGQGQFAPDIFYSPPLLGGSLEYDVDFSQAGCSCNIALYLVSMPGYDWNGNPDPSRGNDYYCDANQVGGVYCPEMDIMQANTWAWHTTPHKCDAPNNKHYNSCDRGGCGRSMEQLGRQKYGPGDQYDINTNNQFHAKIQFNQSNNQLVQIVLTLTQGSKTVVLNINESDCSPGYLGKMSAPLSDGMTIVVSNWGQAWSDMSWLDGDLCQGDCNNSPTASIKNIKITSGGSGPTPPAPGNKWGCNDGGCFSGTGNINSEIECLETCTAGYKFGNPCASSVDKCQSDCGCCCWSWPTNDPAQWNSKDAACRCDPSGNCCPK